MKDSSLGRELIQALGGPKNCETVSITHKVGSVPRVHYTCIVKNPLQLSAAIEVLVKYKLVKRKVKTKPHNELPSGL